MRGSPRMRFPFHYTGMGPFAAWEDRRRVERAAAAAEAAKEGAEVKGKMDGLILGGGIAIAVVGVGALAYMAISRRQ